MFSPWVHQNEYTLRRPTQPGISKTKWTQHSCHQKKPPPVLLWRHDSDRGALELCRIGFKWCSLHIEQLTISSTEHGSPEACGVWSVSPPAHGGHRTVTHHTQPLVCCWNTKIRTWSFPAVERTVIMAAGGITTVAPDQAGTGLETEDRDEAEATARETAPPPPSSHTGLSSSWSKSSNSAVGTYPYLSQLNVVWLSVQHCFNGTDSHTTFNCERYG